MVNMESVLISVLNTNKVFISENDFKYSLAKQLENSLQNEYSMYFEYTPQSNSKVHIDIVLLNEETFIPIEVKYKTKEYQFENRLEKYRLKNHVAYPINKIAFKLDQERITNLRDYKCFSEGYAIFLTNDVKYFNSNDGWKEYQINDNLIYYFKIVCEKRSKK